MITVLSGTNRPGSNTAKIARQVLDLYRQLGVQSQLLDLAEMPAAIFDSASYAAKPEGFGRFSESIERSDGLVVVTPEYNGGMPGALKYFIDMLKFPESFERRPVCFVGLAAGTWGALRPVEQLQQIFGYRNAHIFPERVFLPGIGQLMDDAGQLNDPSLVERLRAQAEGFSTFVEQVKGLALRGARSLTDRLAVCSWSLQPSSPAQLIASMKEIGLNRLQIALDPIREGGAWAKAAEECAAAGLSFASGMFGTIGEDYTTIATIRETGGVVPDHTWEANWKNIQANAVLAEKLGLPLVMFHAGFLPHDSSDPHFAKLLGRLRQIGDIFADHGVKLALETGQETAPALRAFLERVNRRNVGINFDPANMILYANGDPIEAMRMLSPWLLNCHIKDANKTAIPGTWGEEVVVGTGQVDWPGFFTVLREAKFQGDLCIEREAGTQRARDIITAKQFLNQTAIL